MKTSKCKKHGLFTENEAYVCFNKKYKDSKLLRCKKCLDQAKFEAMQKGFNCDKHGLLDFENAYQSIEKGYLRLRCKECHHDRRKIIYANNRDQAILDAAKWRRKNRERVKELAAQDRLNHPEKYTKWRKDYYERNRKAINTRSICKRLGIDIQDYEEMMHVQDNKCFICGKEETRKLKGKVMRLCVDHDHRSGKIRALLCHDCNSGLGKFYDSADLLTKAAIYLMDYE